MRLKVLCCVFAICAVLSFAAVPLFAQNDGLTPTPEAGMPTDMSMYGEVRAVDTASGKFTVQYYDYDTDEEKTAEIEVSKETKYDGVSAFGDIKPNDWIDVIYAVIGGKFTAKSVIVEKEDMAEALPDEAYGAEMDMEGEY